MAGLAPLGCRFTSKSPESSVFTAKFSTGIQINRVRKTGRFSKMNWCPCYGLHRFFRRHRWSWMPWTLLGWSNLQFASGVNEMISVCLCLNHHLQRNAQNDETWCWKCLSQWDNENSFLGLDFIKQFPIGKLHPLGTPRPKGNRRLSKKNWWPGASFGRTADKINRVWTS